jgi:hypothetical protein
MKVTLLDHLYTRVKVGTALKLYQPDTYNPLKIMFKGTGHVLMEIKVQTAWVVSLNEMEERKIIPISFHSSIESYMEQYARVKQNYISYQDKC